MPPGQHTSTYTVKRDVKVGGLHIKAGQFVTIMIHAMYMSSKEWQRPHEFLPQRFDSKDPLFLTPSGKKRHSFSFIPFSAGKRICFGKTFAQTNLRLATTYFAQTFNFELLDKSYSSSNLPMKHVG